jgi:phosphotransferase system HPr (HPr) family protein
MLEARIRVTNLLGLHARAAAQLVRLANTFKSEITVKRPDNGTAANAKSILSVLNLAAGMGIELLITADGEDAADAIDAITGLFANKFGEGS